MAEQGITATESEVKRIQEQILRRKEGSPQTTVSVSQSSEQQSIPASVAEENIIEQTPITQDNWWEFERLDLPGFDEDRSGRDMFQAVISDTITFGLSEEASSAMLALIDKARDVSGGGNTSYSDFYRENVSRLENERLQWQEENVFGTGVGTVLGIAGSIPGTVSKGATNVALPVVSNVLERISPRIAQVSAPFTSRVKRLPTVVWLALVTLCREKTLNKLLLTGLKQQSYLIQCSGVLALEFLHWLREEWKESLGKERILFL